MSNDLCPASLAAWAAKDLPARLHATQVAKLLNCSAEDVAILASSGKLRPLGKPRPAHATQGSRWSLHSLLLERCAVFSSRRENIRASIGRKKQGFPALETR